MSHERIGSECASIEGRGNRTVLIFCSLAAVVVWRMRRTAPLATNDGHWITPQTRMLKVQVNATGIVRLKTGAEVRVGAQLSGIVHRLFVTVGSKVVQGHVIAEIDPRPVQATVQQARAQLAQARGHTCQGVRRSRPIPSALRGRCDLETAVPGRGRGVGAVR